MLEKSFRNMNLKLSIINKFKKAALKKKLNKLNKKAVVNHEQKLIHYFKGEKERYTSKEGKIKERY